LGKGNQAKPGEASFPGLPAYKKKSLRILSGAGDEGYHNLLRHCAASRKITKKFNRLANVNGRSQGKSDEGPEDSGSSTDCSRFTRTRQCATGRRGRKNPADSPRKKRSRNDPGVFKEKRNHRKRKNRLGEGSRGQTLQSDQKGMLEDVRQDAYTKESPSIPFTDRWKQANGSKRRSENKNRSRYLAPFSHKKKVSKMSVSKKMMRVSAS